MPTPDEVLSAFFNDQDIPKDHRPELTRHIVEDTGSASFILEHKYQNVVDQGRQRIRLSIDYNLPASLAQAEGQ